MPIRHSIIHQIDKKPDGSPAILHLGSADLGDSQALETMHYELTNTYNAKPGKAWGLFHDESGAFPFSGWLKEFLDGKTDFVEFSRIAAEHLLKLMEESNLSVGGHLFIDHYQQGLTDYLAIYVLQQAESVSVVDGLGVTTTKYLDLGHLNLAARINLSEWQNNKQSRQYISFIKAKGGRKAVDYFRDFIGVQEGIDAPSETRTLLKAFSDFVESEDLPEASAREKTDSLLAYTAAQIKIGAPISLEELSQLVDEDQPRAFFDHIRNKDYGLSPEIPADKRTLAQFRRFTGKSEGLSISFEAHLLGKRIEYNEGQDTLTIHQVPEQLKAQLKG